MTVNKIRYYKQFPRFEDHVDILAKTFGFPLSYHMTSINVSKSGILTGTHKFVPFQINTLLELTVDPEGSKMEPFECIGKVVRLAEEDRPEQDSFPMLYGICMQDIAEDKLAAWESYLEEVADHVKGQPS